MLKLHIDRVTVIIDTQITPPGEFPLYYIQKQGLHQTVFKYSQMRLNLGRFKLKLYICTNYPARKGSISFSLLCILPAVTARTSPASRVQLLPHFFESIKVPPGYMKMFNKTSTGRPY